MLINVTLRQLQAFRVVATLRSFSEAAERLHLSQPALSATIRKLEETLNTKLFDRTTRQVLLTAEGEELQRLATRLIDEFEAVSVDLQDYLARRRGRLVIAALPSLAAITLPPALAVFKARYPAIDVMIRDTLHDQIQELVESGAADFGLTVAPAKSKDFDFQPLIDDRFVMVCRPDHALARKKAVTWTQMVTYPIIMMARTSSVRQHIDAACAAAGIEVQSQYDPEHLATVGALISQGLGIAALPSLTTSLLKFAGLAEVPIKEPALRRTMGIIQRKGRTPSVSAQSLMEILQAQCTEQTRPKTSKS
ncbi:LysR family transcriptional regulator [uncultured Ferrovibrio sp.]|jgi:Transcriptional regulator|uniref:LysR family transcriptional regulator n=1 Tax=uncultured Ferrovibrio sp. TaxID=1576913 RepID=UPI00261A5F0B|nr:LysR family transcriptional regulator [uncultured Ferrovibrio sp.]